MLLLAACSPGPELTFVTPTPDPERLALQDQAAELAAQLRQNEGDRFAGLTADGDQIAVYLTEGDASTVAPYVTGTPLEGRVEVRPATYTLTELEQALSEMSAITEGLGVLTRADLSVEENRVLLFTSDQEALETALAENEVTLPESIVIRESTGLTGSAVVKEYLLTDQTVYLPVLESSTSEFPIEVSGPLEVAQGCLRVEGYTILWPLGTSMTTEPPEVLDGTDQVITGLGGDITLQGNERSADQVAEIFDDMPCDGPYLLASR